METYNTKIRPWIGIIALLIIGVMMIIQPDAMDGVDPSGRKVLIKSVVAYVWGIPVGIISILFAAFLGYNQIRNASNSAGSE